MNTGVSIGSPPIPMHPVDLLAEQFGSGGQARQPDRAESFLETLLASGASPEPVQPAKPTQEAEQPQEADEEQRPMPDEEQTEQRTQTVTHLMAALLTPAPQQEIVEAAPPEQPKDRVELPRADDPLPAQMDPVQDALPPPQVPFELGDQAQQAQQPGMVAPILEGQHNKEMEPPAPRADHAAPQVQQQAAVLETDEAAAAQPAQQTEDQARMPQATGPMEVFPGRRADTEPVQADPEADSSCPLENGGDPAEPAPLPPAEEAGQSRPESGRKEAAAPSEKEQPAKPAEQPPQTLAVDLAPQRAASADRLQPAAREVPAAVEANHLFDEMVERMVSSEQNGVKMMEILLKPDHLGKVSIQLQLSENGLQARITADDLTVRNAINSQIAQLTEALSDKGIKVSGLDVVTTAVGDHTGDRQSRPNQQQPQQREHNPLHIGGLTALEGAAQPQWWELSPSGVTDAELSTVEYRA